MEACDGTVPGVLDDSRGAGFGGPGRGGLWGPRPRLPGPGRGMEEALAALALPCRLEEVASREPLKSAGRWKPDGWPAGLGPAFQLGQLAQSTPGCVAWEETGSRAGSRAKSCVGYAVALEVAEDS